MKYLLILFFTFFLIKVQAQVEGYITTSGLIMANTGLPTLGCGVGLGTSKFQLESDFITHLDYSTPSLIQQKFGYHIERWQLLVGASYHAYNDAFNIPQNGWYVTTEMRYTFPLLNRFWGFSLQQDGNFVLFGVILGAKL